MGKQFKRGDRVLIVHAAFDENTQGEVNRTDSVTGAVNVFVDGAEVGTWFNPESLTLICEVSNEST